MSVLAQRGPFSYRYLGKVNQIKVEPGESQGYLDSVEKLNSHWPFLSLPPSLLSFLMCACGDQKGTHSIFLYLFFRPGLSFNLDLTDWLASWTRSPQDLPSSVP